MNETQARFSTLGVMNSTVFVYSVTKSFVLRIVLFFCPLVAGFEITTKKTLFLNLPSVKCHGNYLIFEEIFMIRHNFNMNTDN